MSNFIINYNDLVEVYDKDLYSTLENISYSTDSLGNRVEICRCKKFLKQDPQFIVFKVQSKLDEDHYYMLQGSTDLFKSVFPNGGLGNPILTNFSERLNKVFGLTKKSLKLSDIYEVKDGKIICDTKDEVREVVDKIVELNDWDVEVVCNFEDAAELFKNKNYEDLSKLKLDTSKVTNMRGMFYRCNSITSIPQLDTSKVTNMRGMFYGCNSITSIPQLDTSNVTYMKDMFGYCLKLTFIPNLDTSKVTNMSGMFFECNSLTSIPQLDTSKVTDLTGMFYGCRSLTTISNLDTSKVTDMSYMFYKCMSLQKLGYPISDDKKMVEIISTTGIDGKPYKGSTEKVDIDESYMESNKITGPSFGKGYVGVARLKDGEYIGTDYYKDKKAASMALDKMMTESHPGGTPTKIGVKTISEYEKLIEDSNLGPDRFRHFSERLKKCNFAYSNMTSRVLKVKFDPAVLKLNNLNRFLDTFKMLPIVSEVKKDEDTIVLLINTDESQVGVSEIINSALAKVASNVTYQIVEE